jgi:hypothetical protein
MRNILFILLAFNCLKGNSQVSLTTIGTPYTENFSALNCSAANGGSVTWTDNTNLTGWYANHTGLALITQLSASARSNTGKLYALIDGADKSLGSRASGGTNTITYGVRLRNNTGVTITSLNISYFGEQWSIAENNSNVNTISVHYQIGSAITSTTAGTWTAAPALDFDQIWSNTNSSGLGGTACTGTSNQCLALNGNAAANRTLISACLNVNIPAGQDFFLRWQDVDNSANDHHLQIDDLSITPFTDNCSVVLPVTWGEIDAIAEENEVTINWQMESELNNNYFTFELLDIQKMTFQPIATIESKGDHTSPENYQLEIPGLKPNEYFFRLKQTDFDGRNSYSPVQSFEIKNMFNEIRYENGQLVSGKVFSPGTELQIRSMDGSLIFETEINEPTGKIAVPEINSGIVIVQYSNGISFKNEKVWINNY